MMTDITSAMESLISITSSPDIRPPLSGWKSGWMGVTFYTSQISLSQFPDLCPCPGGGTHSGEEEEEEVMLMVFPSTPPPDLSRLFPIPQTGFGVWLVRNRWQLRKPCYYCLHSDIFLRFVCWILRKESSISVRCALIPISRYLKITALSNIFTRVDRIICNNRFYIQARKHICIFSYC